MGWIEGVLFCDGCGAEIVMASLVVRDGAYFCCARCADGERCDCGLVLDDDVMVGSQPTRGSRDIPAVNQ
jgi:hypothetical protein